MSAPNVTVNRTNGGIGRQANGSDYYSGLLFYLKSASTLPTGFATQQIKSLNSINDLIALGIDGKSADETKGTGTWTCSTAGTAGIDTISFTFADPANGGVSFLGTGTAGATATDTATSVVAGVNALTYLTGWSASNGGGSPTAVVTFTPPVGYGASFTGIKPITKTDSASSTIVGAFANFSGGAGSEQDVIYYHVREAFRVQGILSGKAQGQIWVGVYLESGSTFSTFAEVATMQSFTSGQIKQIGVWATGSTFATSHVTALNAQAVTLAAQNQPLAIIYQGNLYNSTTVPAGNLRTLNSQFVQCTYGQDGGNVGNRLWWNLAKARSIGCLGTTLGAWALAGVQQSIISRAVFNVVDSLEFTKLAWANGTPLSGAGLSATIDAVDALGYVFLRNESSPVSSALFGGVFFNNDSMCVTQTSDYAYMPNIRTINKAAVGVRAAILPALGGNVYFNADGTLTVDSINYLQHLGDTVIGGKSASTTGSMASAGEISDGQTIIDPTQNVQSTNTVAITMKIVQAGVARYIVINIGFAASLK
jgi:hypothetical protein